MNSPDLNLSDLQGGDFKIRANGEHAFRCPFCEDAGYHLSVDFERELYHCFRCGTGGRFKRDGAQRVSSFYSPVLKRPGRYVDGDIQWRRLTEKAESDYEKAALKYLHSRGVSLDDDTLTVGLSGNSALDWMLVFPFYVKDRFVTWQARAFHPYAKRRMLNPPRGSGWEGKGETLYNYDRAVASKVPLVVVEGIFDALSLPGGVAICGNSISSDQVRLLYETHSSPIFIFLDRDAPHKAWQVAEHLVRAGVDEVRVVVWEERGSDPADLTEAERYHLLSHAVRWSVTAALVASTSSTPSGFRSRSGSASPH